VEIDFEKLIQLQQLDAEIRQTTFHLDSIPPQIENIDKKIEASSQVAGTAKDKMTASQKRRRDLEAEVKDIKARVAKYKRQLNEVKTNKEYTALLKEIEESQKKVDRMEEEFIAEMLVEDDIQKEIKEANQKFAAAKEKYSREKDALYQKKREMEEKLQRLKAVREGLIPQIPPDQVNLYLRIFRNKGGIALSPVKDDFCALCHMRVRPQVLNELRDTRNLILCENCGRILYWKKGKKAEQETEEAEAEAE
jgi:hypothetical protein